VEELLLDPLLVLEELDVVDQEQVVGAVALLEALDALVAQRVDEVVHEGLARHVAHRELALVLADVLRDRLQEVRLAEPGAAVDEERVVGLRRRFRDGERRGVREAVRRPITNESKVYFGLRPAVTASRRCTSTGSACSPSLSVTASWIRRSCPVASPTAALIRPTKWPSIQSRVKSFGTARVNSFSLSSRPSTWSNHVR
jgi:hypothetical protein